MFLNKKDVFDYFVEKKFTFFYEKIKFNNKKIKVYLVLSSAIIITHNYEMTLYLLKNKILFNSITPLVYLYFQENLLKNNGANKNLIALFSNSYENFISGNYNLTITHDFDFLNCMKYFSIIRNNNDNENDDDDTVELLFDLKNILDILIFIKTDTITKKNKNIIQNKFSMLPYSHGIDNYLQIITFTIEQYTLPCKIKEILNELRYYKINNFNEFNEYINDVKNDSLFNKLDDLILMRNNAILSINYFITNFAEYDSDNWTTNSENSVDNFSDSDYENEEDIDNSFYKKQQDELKQYNILQIPKINYEKFLSRLIGLNNYKDIFDKLKKIHVFVELNNEIQYYENDLLLGGVFKSNENIPSIWFETYGYTILTKTDHNHSFSFILDFIIFKYGCSHKIKENTLFYYFKGYLIDENKNKIFGNYEYFIDHKKMLFHRLFRPYSKNYVI